MLRGKWQVEMIVADVRPTREPSGVSSLAETDQAGCRSWPDPVINKQQSIRRQCSTVLSKILLSPLCAPGLARIAIARGLTLSHSCSSDIHLPFHLPCRFLALATSLQHISFRVHGIKRLVMWQRVCWGPSGSSFQMCRSVILSVARQCSGRRYGHFDRSEPTVFVLWERGSATRPVVGLAKDVV